MKKEINEAVPSKNKSDSKVMSIIKKALIQELSK